MHACPLCCRPVDRPAASPNRLGRTPDYAHAHMQSWCAGFIQALSLLYTAPKIDDPLSPHSPSGPSPAFPSRHRLRDIPNTACLQAQAFPAVQSRISICVLAGAPSCDVRAFGLSTLGMTSLVIRNLACPSFPLTMLLYWQQTSIHPQSCKARRFGWNLFHCPLMATYPVHIHAYIHVINSIPRCHARLRSHNGLTVPFLRSGPIRTAYPPRGEPSRPAPWAAWHRGNSMPRLPCRHRPAPGRGRRSGHLRQAWP